MALIVLRLAEVDRARVVERKSLCPGSRQIMERSVQSCRLTDDNSLSFDVFRNEIPFEIPPPPSRGMVSLMVSNQRIYTRSESRLERGSSNRKLGRGRHNLSRLWIRSIPRGACVSCVLKRRRSRDEGDICSIRVGRGNCSR